MAPLTWLVTGCSSGFGEQFVHGILARGDRVVATGRNASSRLHHLKDTGAAILDLDVSANAEVIEKTVKEALRIYDGIDVLVNNAGYMQSCYIEELTPEILNRQFATNLFGPLGLVRALLPHFRSKRCGTFVFIGSICGWRGDPSIGAYCASKFALEGRSERLSSILAPHAPSCILLYPLNHNVFMRPADISNGYKIGLVESLSRETSHLGIRSIIFEPGFFRTQAFSPTTFPHRSPEVPGYEELDEWIKDFTKGTYGNEVGDPRKAVERILDVVKGEGMVKGEMPIRLPLGRDGMEVLKGKCEATEKICREWEDLIVSTDFEKGHE